VDSRKMLASVLPLAAVLLAGGGPSPRRAAVHSSRRAAVQLSAADFVSKAAAQVVRAGEDGLTAALADDFTARHSVKVVDTIPEVNLALLQLAPTAPTQRSLTFGDDSTLSDGDFVIALGNPQTGSRGGASLGMLVGRSSSSMSDAPSITPGTAEAAMAEAEAEVEAEALERGEAPFLVSDAALVEGASGGPLLDAEGVVVGINTLVISAGEGSTRYYTVSARRCARAVEALVERRTLGEQVDGVRVVLRNDGVNKRERVAAVLAAAGLSEQAASLAMLSAHKTGRGVIGFFETEVEAEALRQKLMAIDKRSQEVWLSGVSEGEGPAARWAQDLLFEAEPCKFYKKEQGSAEAVAASQLEA